MQDNNNLMIKALTMKTPSTGPNNRLSIAAKQIRECIKQAKAKEVEKEVKAGQENTKLEELITSKAVKQELLDNLVIRPNLGARRTIGGLGIHQNGVRFLTNKGQKIDIWLVCQEDTQEHCKDGRWSREAIACTRDWHNTTVHRVYC